MSDGRTVGRALSISARQAAKVVIRWRKSVFTSVLVSFEDYDAG